MKIRLSHYGLAVSFLALFPMVAYGVNALHMQGKTSSEIVEQVDQKAKYLTDVKQDLEEGVYWTIELTERDGKNVGDVIDGGYKTGKLGARTVTAIPKPGKTKTVDQVFRVDQNTGRIVAVFSLKNVNQTMDKEKLK